ncbi:MAG: putative peptidase [Prokaryotic dsDNA virus sp.]|nr:MAG: putative peptidase [Prokaryotic dsDNA virus sp.]|tara:strand:- start:470 stop:2587 length:2118 start_codon:yes stop_codon:yes gene_type:complete
MLKSPKIIKLDIEEFDLESGVDAIALVESPAIELPFMYFKDQFESYDDYPQAASDAACKVLRWIEEHGRDEVAGMTQTGLARANQLCNREKISEQTIARMASFARHKKNSEINPEYKGTPWKDKGYVAWLGWGSDEGINWAQRKLEQIRKEKQSAFVENAGGFSIGDYVSWTFAGRGDDADRGRGQITDLRVSGKLKVPGTDFELSPTEERPAALIETIDGTVVGQYTENLRKIKKPEGFDKDETEQKIEAIMDLVEYIDGLPVYTTIEEAEEVAKEIGCEGYHEHKMEDDIILYMPCSEHDEAIDNLLKDIDDIYKSRKKKKNYITNLPQDKQDKILDKLFEVGETREELEKQGWVIEEMSEVGEKEFAISSKPDLSSLEDYGKFQIRYIYQGPVDSKNRDFCAKMRKANLIYRKEDINKLTVQGENSEFGIYDIFTYKGSYGCRHYWQRLKMFKSDSGRKTITQTSEADDAATSVNAKPTMNRNPNGADVATTKDMVTSNFAEASKEKQLLAGPLMVPNKLIYRYDDNNGEYYVYFSADTIEKIAYKYLENGYQGEVNYDHSEDEKLKDITLVESWIVDDSDKDKSFSLTGEKYDKGTWFGVMKVRNKEVWEDYVKNGLVKGFSVEGFFADYVINASTHRFFYRTTEGGTEIVIDEKSFVVHILEDGKRKAIMPDGEYKLTNGRTLVVVNSKAKIGSFESQIK